MNPVQEDMSSGVLFLLLSLRLWKIFPGLSEGQPADAGGLKL